MTTPLNSVGTMVATFIDPTGEEWPLSNTTDEWGWFTTPEIAGWNATPYEFTLDPVPRGGDDVRYIRSQSVRITWPLHIWGETHTEFLTRYRNIRRAFMSTIHRQTPGILRVARPDGTAREIDVYYEAGFAGEGGENWLSANPVLTLLAPEAYWRDVEPTTVVREYAPGADFLNPFPTISSASVIGTTTIDNPGDVEAWPTWVITGPMTVLTATNTTTSRSFELTYTLTGGQQISITTFRPTVRGPAGQNLVNALNWPTAYLWSLMPGSNNITFTLAGSGAGSRIELDFYPRFDGA